MKKHNKNKGITLQATVTKKYKERVIEYSNKIGISYSNLLFSALDQQLLLDNIKSYDFKEHRNSKISIGVTEKFKKRVVKYCEEKNIYKSEFIISAIENYIDRRKYI